MGNKKWEDKKIYLLAAGRKRRIKIIRWRSGHRVEKFVDRFY
jgi:hypothetical protein